MKRNYVKNNPYIHPGWQRNLKTGAKNGSSKTAPFPASPFLVNLKLPKNYQKRKLYVYVLSPKGDVIYSAPIPNKKENVVLMDKTH